MQRITTPLLYVRPAYRRRSLLSNLATAILALMVLGLLCGLFTIPFVCQVWWHKWDRAQHVLIGMIAAGNLYTLVMLSYCLWLRTRAASYFPLSSKY